MRGPRWLPLWPVAVLLVNAAFMVSISRLPFYGMINTIDLALLQVLALVVTARTAFQRGMTRRERRPWLLLGAYWVLGLVVQVLFFAAFSGGPGHPPKPGVLLAAAITWAVQVAPMLACLLAFPVRAMTRAARIRFGLDMAAVCGGGFIALWFLVLAPALHSTLGSPRTITITQPVLNLVIIFVVCAVMMRGGVTTPRHPLTFLLFGNVALGIGVISVGYVLTRHDVVPSMPAIDILQHAGILSLTTAALLHRRGVGRDVQVTAAAGHRRPTILPYLALGLGYGVLMAAALTSQPGLWIGLIAGALVLTGAIAGRQVIALRENHDFVVRDALTGLASRVAVYDRLNRAVERSTRTGRPTAVLLIDLNGFKPVNDRLGHAAGDELLVAFGDVLRASVRSGDTTGRLGGDEFVVILPEVNDTATALQIAESIVAACAAPFTAAGERVRVGASIGVSITTADRLIEGQELLHQADVAMYHIKRQRNEHEHVVLYDLAMEIDAASVPAPAAMPGLDPAELAELDRLRSRVAELERKGGRLPAAELR
ncbi:GGDEF domain-containing protein [Actinoplanes sp. NPDC051851]|uniref:GGDEF domain-containing protein n=1 Tax=Actinoplanes sp. NPDC051851 TaxID=3154753 RepID=UPI0034417A79